ncbi:hypothetical protein GPECTOR_258g655 [Gonium pectorale]|uniref:Uncharacterized protein n=1 Tax=Gonium pectorale TaxID=33097 RepID=A0A150FW67_GONPE|nr:hypothetical protein GPECTOR_258g655 [Gonium pectorale]|eukprot:KXZ41864.1 hypothetical protein GPECTOR_258g655 [Gonium pectorale]
MPTTTSQNRFVVIGSAGREGEDASSANAIGGRTEQEDISERCLNNTPSRDSCGHLAGPVCNNVSLDVFGTAGLALPASTNLYRKPHLVCDKEKGAASVGLAYNARDGFLQVIRPRGGSVLVPAAGTVKETDAVPAWETMRGQDPCPVTVVIRRKRAAPDDSPAASPGPLDSVAAVSGVGA